MFFPQIVKKLIKFVKQTHLFRYAVHIQSYLDLTLRLNRFHTIYITSTTINTYIHIYFVHVMKCYWIKLLSNQARFSILLYPHYNEFERGGILVSPCPSVHPTVCPSVNKIVSALYLQQYSPYLYILLSNFSRCVVCKVFSKLKNLANS